MGKNPADLPSCQPSDNNRLQLLANLYRDKLHGFPRSYLPYKSWQVLQGHRFWRGEGYSCSGSARGGWLWTCFLGAVNNHLRICVNLDTLSLQLSYDVCQAQRFRWIHRDLSGDKVERAGLARSSPKGREAG